MERNINEANLLEPKYYTDGNFFEKLKRQVFANSWQFLGDKSDFEKEENLIPIDLFPGFLDVPLMVSRDGNEKLHVLSNVCTHRAKILVSKKCKRKAISCKYHGRSFFLDGGLNKAPGFEQTKNFPRQNDHLPSLEIENWNMLLFTTLFNGMDFSKLTAPLNKYLYCFPLDKLQLDKTNSHSYILNANWALYVENYLEGFHVPFVHPNLNRSLELGAYAYEIFDLSNLQIGFAKENEPVFDFPETHPHHGKAVFAYYFWLFPNLMLNFYPWGLSMNIIEPINISSTRIRYRTYKYPDAKFKRADNNIDKTEEEDRSVVESVQQGIGSILYKSGRYAQKHEKGVFHFHELIKKFL